MRTLWYRWLFSFLFFFLSTPAHAITPLIGAALIPAVGFLVSSGTALRMAAYSALGLAGIRLAESTLGVEILSHQADGEVVEQAEAILAQWQTKYEPLCSLVSDEFACIEQAAQKRLCIDATAFGKELGQVDQEIARLVLQLDARSKKLVGHQDHFSVQMRTAMQDLVTRAGTLRAQLQQVRALIIRHAAYFEVYNGLEELKKRLDVFIKHNGQGYKHGLFVKDKAQVTAFANKARICAYNGLLSTALEIESVIRSLHSCDT